jgi:hypothetical protein
VNPGAAEWPELAPAHGRAPEAPIGLATCSNCGQGMRPLALPAHYGRQVEVDVCGRCHLLWFDGLESVHLTGAGILALLRAMQEAQDGLHQRLRGYPTCPRCDARLAWANNQTTHGPTGHHECPRGHGALQSFSLFLAEKGLVRPLYRPELEQLNLRPDVRRPWNCINCGAAVQPQEREACPHCAASLKVLDLRRLVQSVDRQAGAGGGLAVPPARQRRFDCLHCGGSIDPAREARCSHCTMPYPVTDLREALELLAPLADAIEAGAPTAAHRLQRLTESLDGAPVLPRFGFGIAGAPAWLFAAGALFMALVGGLLLWSSWRWLG